MSTDADFRDLTLDLTRDDGQPMVATAESTAPATAATSAADADEIRRRTYAVHGLDAPEAGIEGQTELAFELEQDAALAHEPLAITAHGEPGTETFDEAVLSAINDTTGDADEDGAWEL